MSEILSSYDFRIEHLEAVRNPAAGQGRRLDYEIGYERPIGRLLTTTTCIKDPQDNLIAVIRKAQKHYRLAQDIIGKLTEMGGMTSTGGTTGITGTGGRTSTGGIDSAACKWKVSTEVLTIEGRIYVSETLKIRILEHFHDIPESGHFGSARTLDYATPEFFGHDKDGATRKYVAGCQVCHRVKAPKHAKYGTNMLIELPSRPWEGLTMDFITDQPESAALSYTGIAVIIDRLTKYVIYLPCRKVIDSPELARLFFEHIIFKHSIPDHVITDLGMQFTCCFWARACSHLSDVYH